MNKFYYFEGRIFETQEAVSEYSKNFAYKKYDEILTEKTFEEFEDAFDDLKSQGNSDLDAIEMAVL